MIYMTLCLVVIFSIMTTFRIKCEPVIKINEEWRMENRFYGFRFLDNSLNVSEDKRSLTVLIYIP